MDQFQNALGVSDSTVLTSLSRARDVLVGFAPDGGAGWGEEGGALVLGASLGLQQLNGDFVLAGEQQTWEVDVVFLSKKKKKCTLFSAFMTLTSQPGHVPCSFRDN